MKGLRYLLNISIGLRMYLPPAIYLRLRYLKVLHFYGLQGAALLVGVLWIMSLSSGRQLPLWQMQFYLGWSQLLFGFPLGLAAYRFFHGHETPLYLNYCIRPLERWSAGLLSSMATGALILLAPTLPSQNWAKQLNGLGSAVMTGLQAHLIWICLGLVIAVVTLAIWLLSLPFEEIDQTSAQRSQQSERWLLKLDSISHSYGSRAVLKGVWFSCQQGQVVALLGRNGCGKSTLFKILLGQLKPQHKACFINGHAISHLQAHAGLVSYLPQDSFLPAFFRVRQAIDRITGPEGQWIKSLPRFQRLLQQRVRQLSGGERRLLELAIVLSLPRAFILLDEPFSELEPLAKTLAGQWIQKAAQQAGVIVTDHDYQQVLSISGPLFLLQQGQIQALKNAQQLEKLYLPPDRSQSLT